MSRVLGRKLALRPFLILSVLVASASCQPNGKAEGAGASAYTLEILSTETCSLPSRSGEPARSVLGVKVRLTSHTHLGLAANYFYGSVLTTDGSRYLAELPGCQPVLSAAPLLASESAEGFLNLPVPPQKKAETLVYLPPIGKLPEKDRVLERKLAGAK